VSGHFGFRVISGRVGSGIRSFSVGSFRVRVVSNRVRSGIGSSSFGSFRVSSRNRIKSDRVGYQIVQCQIILNFKSYQVRTDRTDFSNRVGLCHLYCKRRCVVSSETYSGLESCLMFEGRHLRVGPPKRGFSR
jgi:hypothetical protein